MFVLLKGCKRKFSLNTSHVSHDDHDFYDDKNPSLLALCEFVHFVVVRRRGGCKAACTKVNQVSEPGSWRGEL